MTLTIETSGPAVGLIVRSPLDPQFDLLATPIMGRVASVGLQLKPLLMLLENESGRTA